MNASPDHLIIALNTKAIVLDISRNQLVEFNTTDDYDFTLTSVFFANNTVYLGTKEFGVLKTTINQLNDYEEIHPEGPLENDVFSIAVKNKHLQ